MFPAWSPLRLLRRLVPNWCHFLSCASGNESYITHPLGSWSWILQLRNPAAACLQWLFPYNSGSCAHLTEYSAVQGAVMHSRYWPEAVAMFQVISLRFHSTKRCSAKPMKLQCHHFAFLILHLHADQIIRCIAKSLLYLRESAVSIWKILLHQHWLVGIRKSLFVGCNIQAWTLEDVDRLSACCEILQATSYIGLTRLLPYRHWLQNHQVSIQIWKFWDDIIDFAFCIAKKGRRQDSTAQSNICAQEVSCASLQWDRRVSKQALVRDKSPQAVECSNLPPSWVSFRVLARKERLKVLLMHGSESRASWKEERKVKISRL